ncbi:unnamed protein product [Linum trigynum]|uniref:Uncharacterized protein n=1 Tax=Linum trigynum TaxID=586398 RepID=A0AAV2CJJ0_9ROSI
MVGELKQKDSNRRGLIGGYSRSAAGFVNEFGAHRGIKEFKTVSGFVNEFKVPALIPLKNRVDMSGVLYNMEKKLMVA